MFSRQDSEDKKKTKFSCCGMLGTIQLKIFSDCGFQMYEGSRHTVIGKLNDLDIWKNSISSKSKLFKKILFVF